MGKNKAKGGGKRKDMSVFKVAGSKVAKAGKAKPITTNLKRFNSKTQTEKADRKFSDVQAALITKKKSSGNNQSKSQNCKLNAVPMDALPDVNSATEQFSKL